MREYHYDHVHLRSSDDRVQVDHNHEPCRLRERTRLGDAAGLTQYGVNLMRLPPGAWSSQRHWHAKEDEFIYVPRVPGAARRARLR